MNHDPQLTLPGVIEPEQTTRIEFTIPHEPVAWPRAGHRIVWPNGAATMIGRRLMRKTFVSTYAPEGPIRTFKAAAQHSAKAAHWGEPLAGPLKLTALFIFPRHAGKFWKTKFMPRYLKMTKPDLDNCVKALKDALTSIVYVDDAQVAVINAEAWHASGYEEPHVFVEIETLPQG